MPEPQDYQATLTAAEQAAAAGDFEAADTLLRETARLQEAALGPVHPDLANTLNNLGIVSEQTGKTRDAEAFYRRASAIAAASLPTDHPFVATSRQNLEEFCKARGLAFDVPVVLTPSAHDAVRGLELFPHEPANAEPPPPDVAAPPRVGAASDKPEVAVPPAPPPSAVSVKAPAPRAPAPAPGPKPTAAQKPATTRTAAPVDRTAAPRSPIALLLGVAALIVFGLLITQPWSASDAPATPTASAPEPAPPAPTAPSGTVPEPAPPAAVTPPPTRAEEAAPAPASTTKPARSAPTATSAAPAVDARLCRNFSTNPPGTWRCDAAGDSVEPGRLVLLTRVRAPRDTAVVHRWFRGDALRQSVRLAVGANPTGYRTYSRQTVTAGAWRVEVTSADGTVLHEQRFTVQ